MQDSTIGTIYALKHTKIGYDESVIEFWSKYTDTPPNHYRKEQLMDIAIQCILDYIETADNPRFVSWELFQHMRFDCKSIIKNDQSFDDRVRTAIWATLAGVQVRDKNGFVNGFRDLPEEL